MKIIKHTKLSFSLNEREAKLVLALIGNMADSDIRNSLNTLDEYDTKEKADERDGL